MASTSVQETPVPLTGGTGPIRPHLTAIEYRLLCEHSPVLIWRADVNKKCDYFNRVWLEFTGRTLEQELGDGWAEGVHPDDLDSCFQIYVSNFDQRHPFEMEYRLKRHDGEYRWIFDRGVPYTDDNGEFLGYVGSCVDVTERREAEQQKLDVAAEHAAFAALRTSEERLRRAFDIETVGVLYFTVDGRITHANDAFLRMAGYTRADIDTGRLRRDNLTPPEFMPQSRRATEEYQRLGRTTPYEKQYIRRDGSRGWALFAATRLNDQEGVEFVTDITEQKLVEHALRESEAREHFLAHVSQVMASHLDYETSLNALVDLMVPALADVCFFDEVAENGPLRRLAWKTVDAARNKWLSERVKSDVIQSSDNPTAQLLRQGVPEFVPAVTESWVKGTATSTQHELFLQELGLRSLMRIPVRDGDHLIGVLTLARNSDDRPYSHADLNFAISVGHRLAATLRNARLYSELQQAVRMRDEVTSIVSHDLRNPVHTVRMASSLLLDMAEALDPAARRNNLLVIHRAALNMSHLLEDLLDVTKAEAGGLAIEPAATDIGSILVTTLEEFRLQATERGIELSADIPEDLPRARADALRVAQVLSNLFANALKFTPSGGWVRLSAAVAEGEIIVSVADSGIGIAPENVAHVFNRFWQAKRASRASAGLGLAIAKSIVEAHGGRIWVESTEGRGTTFRFTLPVSD